MVRARLCLPTFSSISRKFDAYVIFLCTRGQDEHGCVCEICINIVFIYAVIH